MKLWKKAAAVFMAATMVLGTAGVALADGSVNSGGTTGTGTFTGSGDLKSVFSVTVPTSANIDFYIDPAGLLPATDYAQLGTNSSGITDSSKNFYFANSGGTFGPTSDIITATNKSSFDVVIEVEAALTVSDGIAIAANEAGVTGDDPIIYVGLVSSDGTTETKTSLDSAGVTKSDGIEGCESNFEITYTQANGYKKTVKGDADASLWKQFSFNLEGKAGGDWGSDLDGTAPSVSLTWKVYDPDEVAEEEEAVTYTLTKNANNHLVCNFNGSAPAGTLTAVTVNGTARNGQIGSGITFANGTFKINSAQVTNWGLTAGNTTVVATIGGADYTMTY